MDVELLEDFKRNFFYGMDAKNDIIDYIILNEADKMVNVEMDTIDTDLFKVEYTLEKIKEKIVQLYRFVHLNEPVAKQTYFYNNVDKERQKIEELVQHRIKELKSLDVLAGGVKGWEQSAIYITGGDKWHKYPGRDYYNNLKGNSWIQTISSILEKLKQLEEANKEQYYALFLDTKYNRIKNAQWQLKQEQEYLETRKMQGHLEGEDRLKEVTSIRQELPKQEEEIRAIFSKFMSSVKVSKQDIPEQIKNNLSQEMQKYVSQNFSDYDTISPLKQEATNEAYKERLNKKIQELEIKIEQEKALERE